MTVENMPIDGPSQFALELADIKRRLANLETARRLDNASFSGRLRSIDDTGQDRVVIGRITDDPATYGISIAEGAINVGGGTVRAIDVSRASDSFLNAAVGGSLTTHVTLIVPRPSWATSAVVQAILNLQMSNNSGSGLLQGSRILIDGLGSFGHQQSVPDGETRVLPNFSNRSLSSVGANVTIEGQASVTPGTNSTNYGALQALVQWLR